jgi:hypothetical protein
MTGIDFQGKCTQKGQKQGGKLYVRSRRQEGGTKVGEREELRKNRNNLHMRWEGNTSNNSVYSAFSYPAL